MAETHGFRAESAYRTLSALETPTENPWTEHRAAGEGRFKIRGLFAYECCSPAILDATRDVGRLAPKPAGEDAPSEASEWELRERNGWEEE